MVDLQNSTFSITILGNQQPLIFVLLKKGNLMNKLLLSFALGTALVFIGICLLQIPSLAGLIRNLTREITPETLLLAIAVGVMMAAFKTIPALMARKRTTILNPKQARR